MKHFLSNDAYTFTEVLISLFLISILTALVGTSFYTVFSHSQRIQAITEQNTHILQAEQAFRKTVQSIQQPFFLKEPAGDFHSTSVSIPYFLGEKDSLATISIKEHIIQFQNSQFTVSIPTKTPANLVLQEEADVWILKLDFPEIEISIEAILLKTL